MSQRFGEGSDSIVKASWRCSGDETCLLDCPRDDNVECDHRRDAGVLCFGESNTHTVYYHVHYYVHIGALHEKCNEGEIRLQGGDSNDKDGRVEVCLGHFWGTVCDDGWDVRDATTVCRQLGYRDIGNNEMYNEEVLMLIHLF